MCESPPSALNSENWIEFRPDATYDAAASGNYLVLCQVVVPEPELAQFDVNVGDISDKIMSLNAGSYAQHT